jgi:hypothetical protein
VPSNIQNLVIVGPTAGAIAGITTHSTVWGGVLITLIAVGLTAPHIRGCFSDLWAYRLTVLAMKSSVDKNKTLREYGNIRGDRDTPP